MRGESDKVFQVSINLSGKYHGFVDNSYPLLNNEEEKDRLDRLHYSLRRFIEDNVIVSIKKRSSQNGM